MAPLLEVRHLTKRFGGVLALNRVSLALEPGRVYGLIGPNGSGKSTLFDCITGLVRRDGGAIRFKGRRIDGLGPHQVFQRGISRTFQSIRLFPELTALENLLVVGAGETARARRRALELLRLARLDALAGEYAGDLAYGQQKLLELSRALMTAPELVLLDEPTAGVSAALIAEVLGTVKRLREAGKTVVLVEHDMNVVMGLCDTVVVLDRGQKLAEGPPGPVRSDERVIEAYLGR